MRPCKDCNKAHEMVLASMEYVKVLGFRIRKTEEISETWKKAAQTHAEECVKLREQLHHLRTAAESGMLPQIVKERDALRADVNDLRTLCDQWKQRETELLAEIERLKKPARQHPVAVGEWVRRIISTEDGDQTDLMFRYGVTAQVTRVVKGLDNGIWEYQVVIGSQLAWWFSHYCTPCDPPTEATHDTPEGRSVAESVIRNDRNTEPRTEPDEIKVGDVVQATFWKAGQAAVVKEILSDGRLMLDCSDLPWRVDEVVKLVRKVTT